MIPLFRKMARAFVHFGAIFGSFQCIQDGIDDPVYSRSLARAYYSSGVRASGAIVYVAAEGPKVISGDGQILNADRENTLELVQGAKPDFVKVAIGRDVPARMAMNALFETVGLESGGRLAFLVQEGAATRAIKLAVHNDSAVLQGEQGCASVAIQDDGGRLFLRVNDTAVRQKPRSDFFKNSEDLQLRSLILRPETSMPDEENDEELGFPEQGSFDPYDAALDSIVGEALRLGSPCSGIVLVVAPDVKWGRMALILGGFSEIGFDAVIVTSREIVRGGPARRVMEVFKP